MVCVLLPAVSITCCCSCGLHCLLWFAHAMLVLFGFVCIVIVSVVLFLCVFYVCVVVLRVVLFVREMLVVFSRCLLWCLICPSFGVFAMLCVLFSCLCCSRFVFAAVFHFI